MEQTILSAKERIVNFFSYAEIKIDGQDSVGEKAPVDNDTIKEVNTLEEGKRKQKKLKKKEEKN